MIQLVYDSNIEPRLRHLAQTLAIRANDDGEGTLSVRYYDFATNTDHLIPGNGADSLTDVFGGRVGGV